MTVVKGGVSISKNNRVLEISNATNRKDMNLKRERVSWIEFAERLKKPIKSTETHAEYNSLPKSQKAELKDVGGFVAGTFAGSRRKAGAILGRDIATIDMDSIPQGGTDTVLKKIDQLGVNALVYSTRSHSPITPRLRVLIPFDRTVAPDEYEPVTRELAYMIGMEYADPTTFDVNRIMYYPSISSDSEYIYELFDKPFVSVDAVLTDVCSDYKDPAKWKRHESESVILKKDVTKQQDPLTKDSAVGTFCRVYSIKDVLTEFLSSVYEPTSDPNRFTYIEGSTQGGAIIYDDKFLYSHHATDPASSKLVNAFDLVRLHRYSEKDDEAKDNTPANRLPSYEAMIADMAEMPKIKEQRSKERLQKAQEVFKDSVSEPSSDTTKTAKPTKPITNDLEKEVEWQSLLTTDKMGNVQSTRHNAKLILTHDSNLKGKFAIDEFSSSGIVTGPLIWDKRDKVRAFTEVDRANIYSYIEALYGIKSAPTIDDALTMVTADNKVNRVKEYITGLAWDGIKRLETLFIDYLGADDTEYTRAITVKSFTAGIARVMEDKVKYDNMPILTGRQGLGKSTLLSIMGGEYFTDSLTTFEGKESAEMIQGIWIVEIGELAAMRKHDENAVKQFLSKTKDRFRQPYARQAVDYPRRCIFFGSSNENEYLRDMTGNRRYWPCDVGIREPTKDVWKALPAERDQIWAEAYFRYMMGEPLYLSKRLDEEARRIQEEHRVTDSREGLIKAFIERKVPKGFDDLSLSERRIYWATNKADSDTTEELEDRKYICASEIWYELLGGELKHFKKSESIQINQILGKICGNRKTTHRSRAYGKQRTYEVKNEK